VSPIDQAEKILKRFEPLDLQSSLDILYFLNEQNDDIIFKNKATTPDKLFNRLYSGYHPKSIQIKFFGGPKGAWHNASIYAYILDRIARIIVIQGYDTAVRTLRYGIKAAYGC